MELSAEHVAALQDCACPIDYKGGDFATAIDSVLVATKDKNIKFFDAWGPSLPILLSKSATQHIVGSKQIYSIDVQHEEQDWLEWVDPPVDIEGSPIPVRYAIGNFEEQLGIRISRSELISEIEEISLLIGKAFLLLSSHKGYYDWVMTVTRGLVLKRIYSDRIYAASSSELPGLYYCSVGEDDLELSEALVHESAHQWYFVAERVNELTNDADTKKYYSPFKRKDREIRVILQTYHAFANVLIYYIELRHGGPRCVGEREIFNLRDRVLEIEGHLDKTNGLTVWGREFFCTLRTKLHRSVDDWNSRSD